MELLEKIKNIISVDDLKNMVTECYYYDCSLSDLMVFDNDAPTLQEKLADFEIDEVLRMAKDGAYNYYDEFFKIEDGNLYSYCSGELELELLLSDEEIIEKYIELRLEHKVYIENQEIEKIMKENEVK